MSEPVLKDRFSSDEFDIFFGSVVKSKILVSVAGIKRYQSGLRDRKLELVGLYLCLSETKGHCIYTRLQTGHTKCLDVRHSHFFYDEVLGDKEWIPRTTAMTTQNFLYYFLALRLIERTALELLFFHRTTRDCLDS